MSILCELGAFLKICVLHYDDIHIEKKEEHFPKEMIEKALKLIKKIIDGEALLLDVNDLKNDFEALPDEKILGGNYTRLTRYFKVTSQIVLNSTELKEFYSEGIKHLENEIIDYLEYQYGVNQ